MVGLFKRSEKKLDYYQPEPKESPFVAKTSVITWLWLFILMLAVATVVLFIIWYCYQQPVSKPKSAPQQSIPTQKLTTVSPTLPFTNGKTTPASLLQNITLATTNTATLIDFHFNGKASYSILHQPATNQLILTLPHMHLTQTTKFNKLKMGLVVAISSLRKADNLQVIIKTKPNTDLEHVTYLKDHKTLQIILYQK